ncbi:MAG: lamin tail domain-containing protein, partial [Cyanobacteria bacterium P01_H01_bin.150]
FTTVADGDYKIKVDSNDSEIPADYGLGTPNDLEITVAGAAVTEQNFGFDLYEVSPSAGQVIINEVFYSQTGNSAAANDEFIEIYNASTSAVDLTGWKLMDGNIIANNTDNTGSITGSSNPYEFPNGTTLNPGEYAVIWIGDNIPNHQASGAKFQDWLDNAPKLNNTGDDIWLYDGDNKIIDYVAYGSGTAINQTLPSSLNLWDSTHQAALAGANKGQSISLTKNGLDGNTSACWEPTTSGQAQTQGCTNYLPTIDSDTTESRVTSAGGNNNGIPKVVLVKRITAINGQNTNPNDGTSLSNFVDDITSPRQEDDNNPNWPNSYLLGAIDAGKVKPGDEIEYTVYFLSTGNVPARNVLFCDRVPGNVSFIPNSFSSEPKSTTSSPSGAGIVQNTDRGILWEYEGKQESLSNVQDGDLGQYFNAPNEPSTVYSNIQCDGSNNNGAVVVNLQDLDNATGSGTPNTSYGFIRFKARVNPRDIDNP